MYDSDTPDSKIAIIGMAGRFPCANDLATFWQNLRDGVESITFFSDQELEATGVVPALLKDPHYVKAGGILNDIEMFDAAFFGYSPREAEIMDPQHRLFLECCWQALEDAGYDPEKYTHKQIGLYAGGSISTYLLFNLHSHRDLLESVSTLQIAIGNDKDHLPTRVSYKLNLKGPSVNVNTACSTSLVAVHLACQSLLNGECDMALAGGVTVGALRKSGYLYREGEIGSPDGHCRAFDAQAQGTTFGNGAGVVVLKRLEEALNAGDYIYAVIDGSAINNDGATKVSYTAPSVEGQASAIAEALAMANVPAESITYVEAHGTGTALGDPIEVAALTQAFRSSTDKTAFCALGSLKTNIGHLGAAAGVAGLIKTVLALQHQALPPSLHFEQPNPAIPFADSPFYVNRRLTAWNPQGGPRRAGVSSFGIGGTNAHVVLEEAPPMQVAPSRRQYCLLPLSARTPSALQAACQQLREHLEQHPEQPLADVAYTLQVGRRAFRHRAVLVGQQREQLIESLSQQNVSLGEAVGQSPVTVFLFPGQGSQYVQMGRGLYEQEPSFRQWVDRGADLLHSLLGKDLRTILYPSSEQQEQAQHLLSQTKYTQPALFVIEYALAHLWMEWGVCPQAMLGHSVGEYVAACLAGVFTWEEALRLVAVRGQLMQEVPEGGMLAVSLSEAEVRERLPEGLSLAAVNAPGLCSVAGPRAEVKVWQQQLTEQGVQCRVLHTSHAFHSAMMEPIQEAFGREVEKVSLQSPRLPYISNVTGEWIREEEARDAAYWVRHLREPVRFAQGLQAVMREEQQVLLEVGPGHTLSTFAHQQKGAKQLVLQSLRRPQEQRSDEEFLLYPLGKLWLAGVQIDWERFYTHERRQRLPLPTYPFERKRYWLEYRTDAANNTRHMAAPGKQTDIANWFYAPSWKGSHLPVSFTFPASRVQPDTWLVLLDEGGLGANIIQRLLAQGEDIVQVIAGSFFESRDEKTYSINPVRRSDYITLFQMLNKAGKRPTRVLHLWSLASREQEAPGNAHSQLVLDRGFYSLLLLAQTIGEQWQGTPFHIDVVSNGVCAVGEESLDADKATLLGPCKVIPKEYPSITCRYLDIVEPKTGTAQEQRVLDQLLTELMQRPVEPVVAYRGTTRWVQTFEQVRLEKDVLKQPVLREGGVYLITGGLGGIGLTLARHLVKTVHARLILMGRSALPDQSAWQQWIADHGDQNVFSKKIQALQELQRMGAEIHLCTADVTDQKQVESSLAQAYERFHEIHGVIHAAGLPGGGIIRQKKLTEIVDVFAPKLQGTRVLSELFKHVKLDFFVLCSSLASIVGNAGQVDYCAANAFLDAYVHENSHDWAASLVSINWDTWQEIGMAVNTGVSDELALLRTSALREGILPAEGIDAFERILCSRLPHVIVSTRDLQVVIASAGEQSTSDAVEETKQAEDQTASRDMLDLQSTYAEPRNDVEYIIADIWKSLLGVRQVGIHDSFFELGGHSLIAIQVIARIREAFQVDTPLRSFFEAATVADLAGVLIASEREPGQIEKTAHILRKLESMSNEDVKNILRKKQSERGEGE
jgi:acyl transferase domain-containing protein/acyl carrier protein